MRAVLLVRSDGRLESDTDTSEVLRSSSGETLMLITDDIFHAFLQCETKAHLKLTGAVGDQRVFSEWERHLVEDYKQQCYRQWRADFEEAACLVGVALPQDLANSRCRLAMDCTVRTQEMQAHLHAVERVASPSTAGRKKESLLSKASWRYHDSVRSDYVA
jgi:hypothetical protein